jgi:chromatin remodeling complex protein RSC6
MAPRKSTKKDASSTQSEPVSESSEVSTTPVETPVETSTTETVPVETPTEEQSSEVDKFVVVLELLQRWATDLKQMTTMVKTLQKDYNKVQKTSAKKPKKSASTKTRTPSGFAKPTKLSDELCSFLGVPAGSQLARTEVTRVLNEYIKKHNLQDTNDKRTIVPDEKLSSILKLEGDSKLTYFNLQTFIKHHFQKDT